jgi:hypothetical protein
MIDPPEPDEREREWRRRARLLLGGACAAWGLVVIYCAACSAGLTPQARIWSMEGEWEAFFVCAFVVAGAAFCVAAWFCYLRATHERWSARRPRPLSCHPEERSDEGSAPTDEDPSSGLRPSSG